MTTNESQSPQRRWRHHWLIAALATAVVCALLYWVVQLETHSVTLDAFVDSHLINVSPQVQGDIVQVMVQEQMSVTKGQLLAVVDPRPYEREVNLTKAKLEVAQSALAREETDLQLLIEQVPKQITIAELQHNVAREAEAKAADRLVMITQDVDDGVRLAVGVVEAKRADLVLAEQDFVRYAALFDDGAVPQRTAQVATKTFNAAKADVVSAEAALGQAEARRKEIEIAQQQLRQNQNEVRAAEQNVELAKLGDLRIEASRRRVQELKHSVEESQRAVELADIRLNFTHIYAPYDGIIAKKWRHLGDYAGTGEPIFSMYNPKLMYVTVNLEETRLEGVNPGNAAELKVEAFDRPFRGRVLWVGSATDANFSLVPRDVSSGEFTYVVQRVPVRIWFDEDERFNQLKPGLSVRVKIDHGQGDPQWAAATLREQAALEDLREFDPSP